MIRAALAAALGFWSTAAAASGGAHVIDDAAVETPGICHLESWAARTGPGATSVTLAPACTFVALPVIEFGAAVTVARGPAPETVAGPALKWHMLDLRGGGGLGLLFGAGFDLAHRHGRTVSLIAPLTLPFGKRTIVNLNLGALHQARRTHAVGGAQIERQVGTGVTLMAEGYRLAGVWGAQTGLRWTPPRGRHDIDLLIAREGGATRATLGLTLRRAGI